MAKKKIEVSVEEAKILVEAMQGKVDELSKIATQLMKKNLQDAAAPVYEEMKRINTVVADLEDSIREE